MRRTFLPLIVSVLVIATSSSAIAMGSGDKYVDLQTGVTYVVYKPTATLGLPALNFEVRPCRLFPKRDEYLLAGFGSMDRGISVVETSAKYNCTGLDHPKALAPIKINGIKAKVGIYCSVAKCSAADFAKYGGEITFITPATKLLQATFIRIGTQGGFSLQQLIAFAKGLKPVGSRA